MTDASWPVAEFERLKRDHNLLALDLSCCLRFHRKETVLVWRDAGFRCAMGVVDGLERQHEMDRRFLAEGAGGTGRTRTDLRRPTLLEAARARDEHWAAARPRNRTTEKRPDLLVMPYQKRPDPTVYEVKVSRADFQSDVRAGKWRHYRHLCNRLYFAAPAGMLAKHDLPEGAGLIERSESQWKIRVKAPETRTFCPTDSFMLSLVCRTRDPMPWEVAREHRP